MKWGVGDETGFTVRSMKSEMKNPKICVEHFYWWQIFSEYYIVTNVSISYTDLHSTWLREYEHLINPNWNNRILNKQGKGPVQDWAQESENTLVCWRSNGSWIRETFVSLEDITFPQWLCLLQSLKAPSLKKFRQVRFVEHLIENFVLLVLWRVDASSSQSVRSCLTIFQG